MVQADTSYVETQEHFYAIGYGKWGRGRTEAEALQNLRRERGLGDGYLIYKVPAGTDFYNDGTFGYPMTSKTKPEVVKRMRKVNGRWKEVQE